MRRLLAGLVTLAAVNGMAAPVSAQTIGVVLMHGNTDSPSGNIALLAEAMEGAGLWSSGLRCAGRIGACATGHSSSACPSSMCRSRG
jgi:hypothetical protein